MFNPYFLRALPQGILFILSITGEVRLNFNQLFFRSFEQNRIHSDNYRRNTHEQCRYFRP